jgi:Ca2+:H+ antiporter
MNASMLALAVIGLGIPTLFDRVGSHGDSQAVSDVTAAILLVLYVLMLVFFFRTPEVGREGHEKHAVPHWPARLAMLLLLLSTGAVAVIADVFVGTLNQVISDLGISAVFLGLIIVPLVGNIAENIVGIKIAYENDMDFSMLVSLGSSLQIALGVAPMLVFISLAMPHSFDLVFPPIQIIALVAAVFITALIAIDGESNWLEGAQLVAVYAIIATAVWYL